MRKSYNISRAMESQRSRASIASGTAGRYGAIEQNAIDDDQDRSLEPWLLTDLFHKNIL